MKLEPMPKTPSNKPQAERRDSKKEIFNFTVERTPKDDSSSKLNGSSKFEKKSQFIGQSDFIIEVDDEEIDSPNPFEKRALKV